MCIRDRKENRHQVGDQDDGKERVAELRSAGEVGCPVAGVHVTDGDEVSGSGKGEDFPPPGGAGDRYGPINFGEGGGYAGAAPARFPLRKLQLSSHYSEISSDLGV